jgi:hypothetical protein
VDTGGQLVEAGVLPADVLRLPEELDRVDALLGDLLAHNLVKIAALPRSRSAKPRSEEAGW